MPASSGPNGTVIERGSIVVRAGKIASVAAGEPSSASGRAIDAKIVDAKGMTAMPGFIDAHKHINTGPDEKAQMQALLEAGYTTILSGGGPGGRQHRAPGSHRQGPHQWTAHHPVGVLAAEQ